MLTLGNLVPAMRVRGKVSAMGSSGGDTGSRWRKSRHSIGNGNCVQVAASPDMVLVRDSSDTGGPMMQYSTRAWRAFLAAARAGTYPGDRRAGWLA